MTENLDVSLGSTSLSLLDRIRHQQAEAWSRFVDLYGPLIYRWARHSHLQSSDAADVVQEVFRSVATNIHLFRRDQPGDSFRAWLRTITRNKVRDHFRKHQGELIAGDAVFGGQVFARVDDPVVESDEDGEAGGLRPLVYRALELVQSEFEATTWRAFWRVVVDEQRPKDVAQELEMTLGAVYMAKSRVTRRVRAELEGLLD